MQVIEKTGLPLGFASWMHFYYNLKSKCNIDYEKNITWNVINPENYNERFEYSFSVRQIKANCFDELQEIPMNKNEIFEFSRAAKIGLMNSYSNNEMLDKFDKLVGYLMNIAK